MPRDRSAMTFQSILISLKKIRGKHQTSLPHTFTSIAKPLLTKPFCNTKQIPPAQLEQLYINNMSDGFFEACPGDVLSIKVAIARDKVSSNALSIQFADCSFL